MKEVYQNQVRLLLEVLPFIRKYKDFAVKGGTAFNLFYRDMPRLSVDIDLTFLPLQDRKETYLQIHEQLTDLKERIEKDLQAKVITNYPLDGKGESRLIIEQSVVRVKIEPNYIIRGSVFPPTVLPVAQAVSEKFHVEVEAQCLSKADLVGGKICAALDRQHPRDLFDIHLLLQEETWPRDYTEAFIFYLIPCPRPFHEMLNPNFKSLNRSFEVEFRGMTEMQLSMQDLEIARQALVDKISKVLTKEDRELLLSIAIGAPQWKLFRHSRISEWPSVRWKMLNIEKMTLAKREEQWEKLESCLT